MSKRLVIIDGKSVFYRGYYAMPNLSTKDGTPTGGVYGFATMALEVVKKLQPDYVCVAWDKARTNIRSRVELYPQYKANRKPAPPDFYEQIPLLMELLQSLGWPLYEADDYEADDLMGAFAKQAGQQGIESYLITSDLDVLQLINSHTHIYTLKKGLSHIELFNEASFRDKYGVGAHQWVDVKALKGDSSDNVPGVAGVGEKTALDLIQKYQTLDGVYRHLEELKPSLRQKLEAGKDMAYLSKQLVTLMVDAPVTLDLAHAKLHDGVTPEFVAVLRKFEFKNMLRQAEAGLSPEEIALAQPPTATLASREVAPWTPEVAQSTDPEMQPLYALYYHAAKDQLWMAWAEGPAYVLEDFSARSPHAIHPELAKLLTTWQAIGHDLKTTFRVLLTRNLPLPTVAHDLNIGAFLLDSLQRDRSLAGLLGFEIDQEDPGQVMAALWHLYYRQQDDLAAIPKLQKLARQIDFPAIGLLAHMEHRGILLNSAYLQDMSQKFATRIAEFEQKIYELAGQEFNISSPVQLGAILYDTLGLPTQGVKKGKTGYSTGAAELAKLRGLHPIIDLVSTYREYTKLKSTYIDALPKLVGSDGRLHTTFTLDVAATGRLSSINPNLQNIPTRTSIGQAIRSAFIPDPGNVFVSADYNQFELRLSAVMAGDQQLIDEFNQDVDVHTVTAAQIYGVPVEHVTKDMRRRAKTVNFGVLYGMSPHGLSVATGMSPGEARDFIQKYFELRSSIKEYMDRTVQQALQDGYVETLFGRRRPTPDLKSSNFIVREAAKRAAINMPIQGTEADLMKLAMLRVEEGLGTGPDALGRQLLQVHDSILVECPEAKAPKVADILRHTMEAIHEALPVKLRVDVSTGKSWGEV